MENELTTGMVTHKHMLPLDASSHRNSFSPGSNQYVTNAVWLPVWRTGNFQFRAGDHLANRWLKTGRQVWALTLLNVRSLPTAFVGHRSHLPVAARKRDPKAYKPLRSMLLQDLKLILKEQGRTGRSLKATGPWSPEAWALCSNFISQRAENSSRSNPLLKALTASNMSNVTIQLCPSGFIAQPPGFIQTPDVSRSRTFCIAQCCILCPFQGKSYNSDDN